MNIILNKDLKHQIDAVQVVADVFECVNIMDNNIYANPLIDFKSQNIKYNIKKIQEQHGITDKQLEKKSDILILDIKMETGTGKTYVYTNTIYELHKRYNFNKFIIIVPSLAIKSGTKQFIEDEYVQRHFEQICDYGTRIDLEVLNAKQGNKKNKSNNFPLEIINFLNGTKYDKKRICVLLINAQLFSKSLLTRDDYDINISGHTCPLDAIKETMPVVIIDEPHRFSKDNITFKNITEKINPQFIIRYGATFPDIKIKQETVKDYENLLYNLNAAKAFNDGLVKGINKEHLVIENGTNGKLKIINIENRKVRIKYIDGSLKETNYILSAKDSLSVINEVFQGVYIEGITNNKVEFSNGVEKRKGDEIFLDIYMTDYQTAMLKLALERHFETEYENFCNSENKIKTLALFFIDDILSYRNEDKSKAYLVKKFEELLKERLNIQISNLKAADKEYKEYLQASLENISKCHAGYFSKDNSSNDEEINYEIELILKGKKELLSFKNEKGEYNLTRFLFSKWTLKEGWDNPNIFTIAKLRSSGSEISKLQEVGRGLRLPVAENGMRIDNQEFRLNYIVDFTEKDFAEKLLQEINVDIPDINTITTDQIVNLAKNENKTPEEFLIFLLSEKYVDIYYKIIMENREKLLQKYPLLEKGLKRYKVSDKNKGDKIKSNIRPIQFNKIKDLWKMINQKCIIVYDKQINDKIEKVFHDILINGDDVFHLPMIDTVREYINVNNKDIEKSTTKTYFIDMPLDYNIFLKRLSNATSIPVGIIHKVLCAYDKKIKKIKKQYFNEVTIANIIRKFCEWGFKHLNYYFEYKKFGLLSKQTALTNNDGSPKQDILRSYVGKYTVDGEAPLKYLYDTIVYDSELEKDNIQNEDDRIIVYGKIPKNSISIPIVIGGTYSPDFMYIVEHSKGTCRLNLIIETKDVVGNADLRKIEEFKIESAKKFFKALEINNIKIHFTKQFKNNKIINIINDIAR